MLFRSGGTDRQAGRQRLTGRQAEGQTDRQTGRQVGRHAEGPDRQAERQTGRQTGREADRQVEPCCRNVFYLPPHRLPACIDCALWDSSDYSWEQE